MPTKLTQEEAFTFLKNILKIPNPQLELTQKNKLDFLNLFIKSWYEHLPFQNVHQIWLTKKENRPLTVPEIIQHQMEGRGGICLYNALFCHHLLAALNFDVHFASATIVIPQDHVVVIAKNIEKAGDSFLVEAGCGWPTFHAIPLDTLASHLSSCTPIIDSFLEYTYIREENLVVRYHRKGDFVTVPNAEYKDGWRRQSYFSLTPVTTGFLYSEKASIVKTIKDVQGLEGTSLMKSPRIVLYPGMRFVAISNWYLNVEEDGERVRKKIKSEEEMYEMCKVYFPMLDIDILKEVLDMAGDWVN